MHKKVVVDIHSTLESEKERWEDTKCIGPPTRNFPGTIHIHIPIVSASRECPKGKTSGWSNTSLKIYDFPFRYGPVIDTTQTGPVEVENQMNITNELEWKSCLGEVVMAQDLESNEPKLII